MLWKKAHPPLQPHRVDKRKSDSPTSILVKQRNSCQELVPLTPSAMSRVHRLGHEVSRSFDDHGSIGHGDHATPPWHRILLEMAVPLTRRQFHFGAEDQNTSRETASTSKKECKSHRGLFVNAPGNKS